MNIRNYSHFWKYVKVWTETCRDDRLLWCTSKLRWRIHAAPHFILHDFNNWITVRKSCFIIVYLYYMLVLLSSCCHKILTLQWFCNIYKHVLGSNPVVLLVTPVIEVYFAHSFNKLWWHISAPHLSDNYVDLSDLFVDLSDNHVDLSDLFVEFSFVHLFKNSSWKCVHAQFMPSS
jgi:hypothetical protein